MRTELEANPRNTIELQTNRGVFALTILGFVEMGSTPSPNVVGYVTDNPITPMLRVTAAEARRFAEHILRAAEAAEAMCVKTLQPNA
jgi:hypothetical protein